MWQTYFQPQTLPAALALLREHADQCRIVAGATDVLVELSRGIRPAATLIDITGIGELDYVRAESGTIRLGALATHNDVLASHACRAGALPLVQACAEIGAPQIRARATVSGNLVTASPANDTIAPLLALGAELVLASAEGERVLALDAFYTGVRRTQLAPGELVRELRFAALGPSQRGIFRKLGLRRAQAISVVNLAIVLTFADDNPARVASARIALGAVAPTVLRATNAESFLAGRTLDEATCAEAGRLAAAAATPIDDLRGSARYRLTTLAALVAEALGRLGAGESDLPWLGEPVLLEKAERATNNGGRAAASDGQQAQGSVPIQTIHTAINGQAYAIEGATSKTLLDVLRDNVGLTGSKLGCGEGECGACTVWINGQAAMACLVPSAQAHGASITTIEGLAYEDARRAARGAGQGAGDEPGVLSEQHASLDAHASALTPQHSALHPLQRAFIEHGAVQCGYCIPGMLMAGAALLEEHAHPTREQAQQAISGNICRCTGYRKILEAIEAAAQDKERGSGGAGERGSV